MVSLARSSVLLLSLGLTACGDSPSGLPCTSGKLSGAWTAVQIPQLGGTVCSESTDRLIRVKHRGTDVPAHRDAYRAAFAAAGWTDVNVVTDDPAEFAADFSRAGGGRKLAVSIDRRGGLVELNANLAGPDWPKAPPSPGSYEEAAERAEKERQQDVQRAIDLGKSR